MLVAPTEDDARCAWLIDGWTDNGIFAPEVAQLRDVTFLMKMMICDPHALRETTSVEGRQSWLKNTIVFPSSLQPSWEVTSETKLCLRWGPYADIVRLDLPRSLAARKSLADAQCFGVRPKGSYLHEDDVVRSKADSGPHVPQLDTLNSTHQHHGRSCS